MSSRRELELHVNNLAAAALFALSITLLALSCFDVLGYDHFLTSLDNL